MSESKNYKGKEKKRSTKRLGDRQQKVKKLCFEKVNQITNL